MKWSYVEPGEDDEPRVFTLSEEEILLEYFDHWSDRMRRAGKAALISEAHCIEDWVTIHWAQRVEEP